MPEALIMEDYMDPTLSSAPAQREQHPPFDEPVRTLTVACDGGLCNRLGILIFGLALAEATGRQFTMWWPRSPDCGAAFHELFEDNGHQLNVIEVDRQQLKALPRYGGKGRPPMFDILTAEEPHVALLSWNWLTAPDRYPAHRLLWKRAAEWLEALTPVAGIRSQVKDFRQVHFRPKMIGVHLRRGDFHSYSPEAFDNTRNAMAQVDAYLREAPDAGILLCTDDGAKYPATTILTPKENVGEKFRRRYGDRVVMTTPRSLARDCPEAIQDALVDLLLLRSTDYVVGTSGSSFSVMAHLGRPVPHVNVATNSLRGRRLAQSLAMSQTSYKRRKMRILDRTDQRKISKHDAAVAMAWDTVDAALVDAAGVDLSWIQPPPRNDWWTLAPDALRLLVSLVAHVGPRHILEFGSGLSTRVLAWACAQYQPSCRVTSIDHDPEYSQIAQKQFAACRLNCHVRFQVAPLVARTYARKLLPTYHLRRRQFASQRPVDLVLIDGPAWPLGGREGTLYQILEFTRPGTIVLLDDAGRKEEAGVLANWQAVLGDAIEVRLLPNFVKGLAAIIVREPHILVKPGLTAGSTSVDPLTGTQIQSIKGLEKLGSAYGGWIVPMLDISEDAVCYLAGVGEDITFDLALIARFNCNVFAFDPTPRAKLHVHQQAAHLSQFHFFDVGLWDAEGMLKFYAPSNSEHVSHSIVNLQNSDRYFEAPCKRLSAIMREMGHSRIQLLKLDIEGAEYRVIDSLVEDRLDIDIICVEYHAIHNDADDEFPGQIKKSVARLCEIGYVLVAVEPNLNYTFVKETFISQ